MSSIYTCSLREPSSFCWSSCRLLRIGCILLLATLTGDFFGFLSGVCCFLTFLFFFLLRWLGCYGWWFWVGDKFAAWSGVIIIFGRTEL